MSGPNYGFYSCINGFVIASLAIWHYLNDRVKENQITLDESEIREPTEDAYRGLSAVIC